MAEQKAFTVYDTGRMFYHGFITLMKIHDEARTTGNYADLTLLIPSMTNGAFAIELFLKSLLGQPVRGHRLYTLYQNLEEQDGATALLIQFACIMFMRKRLKKPSYSEKDFREDFIKHERMFEEIRYFYEPREKDLQYSIDFTYILAGILCRVCESKFGPRPLKNKAGV